MPIPMQPCPFCKSSERSLRLVESVRPSSIGLAKIITKRVTCICGAEGPPVVGAESTEDNAVLRWNNRG